ncbi:peptidylprolyl isomerase [archaeon]|jgi:FKBP-type peptidyl-prolyl cis-trans isomerase 2|nr:peptidylprolyl isomerase [archaeon]
MVVKKNDFVEVEFSGRANGELFDTTSKEEAKEMNLEADVKPVIVSVGNEMMLKGFDSALEGKEIGKDYSVHLAVKDAFGVRNPALIRTIPMRVFREKNMNPVRGMTLQMDNQVAKVISVSGGRVMVDFNNPLAGKEIDYDFKILRKVDSDEDKVNALQDFFFRQRFEFSIENGKVSFRDEKIKPLVGMMAPKFEEMSGLKLDVGEGKGVEDIMKGISSGKGDGGDEKGEKVVEDKKVVEEKNQNVDKKKKEGIDKFSN